MRDARSWLVVVTALAGCGEVKDPTPPEVDAPAGPTATVTISPTNPKTADDLVATVSGATVTLRWSLNAVVRTDVTGATIANTLTAKGERWAVDAVSSTGEVLDHDEVVIGNTAPSMFDVEVAISGTVASPVSCSIVTMATDDDTDTVTYAATWLRNGVAYTNATMTMFPGDTVPGADHAAGDQFECSVAGSDGTDATTAIAGGRVLVPNGVPPNGTIQNFTTPAVASLRIEAGGARGAGANTNGAVMIGTFTPTAGSVLQILVGQSPTAIAGAGGTFVMASATMPMVIAGGGGSVFSATVPVAESQGRIVTSGGTAGAVVRADNGQGGRNVSGSNSGGGGGLLANGAGVGGGKGFAAGAAGGGIAAENQWGGFGGGGGRTGLWGQGAGGGYSGGSCADTFDAGTNTGTWVGCGGGGSINMGTDPVNTAGGNTGTGYVKITW